MLHRVLPKKLIGTPNAYSEFGTLISQEYLTDILQWLTDSDYKFTNISNLPNNLDNNKLIALTFDDGYIDNFHYAYPILKRYNATATFFPLAHTALNNCVLPLDTYYQCVDELELDENERKNYIKGDVKKKFYWSDPQKQMDLLHSLFNKVPQKSRVQYMTPEQLVALSNDDFEIGSHGVSHSLLTADYMTKEKIIFEMEASKKWFESILGKKVVAYCFPAGLYNLDLIKIAKKVGYTSISLISKKEKDNAVLPSYSRVFVKPDAFDELKEQLIL